MLAKSVLCFKQLVKPFLYLSGHTSIHLFNLLHHDFKITAILLFSYQYRLNMDILVLVLNKKTALYSNNNEPK